MYTIKESYQLKDHGIESVDVAYMDIRAFGKGFDEFYDRARDSGVRFTRGRPARVRPSGAALAWGIGLAVLYVLASCWFFTRMYKHAVRTGLIARYSAESVS